MKQILCFGDSNTHGFDAMTCGRYDYHTRWTGLVNEALGERALICEAGLNGRTCGFEDPEVSGRNGLMYLNCELKTHKPLDAVVLMLGTNDCKAYYHADGAEIARQMEKLIRMVQTFSYWEGEETKILLVSPVPLDENCVGGDFDGQSVETARSLGEYYRRLAEKWNIAFADAGEWGVQLDFDGTHFTPQGHRRFAEKITEELGRVLDLAGKDCR